MFYRSLAASRLAGAAFFVLLMSSATWAADLALVIRAGEVFTVHKGTPESEFAQIGNAAKMEDLQWSHDGTHLAYTTKEGDTIVLHALNITTGAVTRVSGPEIVVAYQWSTSGDRLAYSTYDADTKVGRILVSDCSGAPATVVSGELNPGVCIHLSFSHDARYLAFGIPDPQDEKARTCAVADLVGGHVTRIEGIDSRTWAWSPSAAVLGIRGIAAGTKLTALYTVPGDLAAAPTCVSKNVPDDVLGFEWSPNGRHISLRVEPSPGTGRSFIVDSASGEQCMVQGTANVINFVWSPDGRKYVIEDGDVESDTPRNRLRVGELGETLTGETWLVPGSLGVGRLTWSSQSDALAFLIQGALFQVFLKEREPQMAQRLNGVEAVAYRPGDRSLLVVQLTQDKRALRLVHVTPQGQGRVRAKQVGKGEFRCPLSPDWSPDGKYILALAHLTMDNALGLVFTMGDETKERKLSDAVVSASWFPQ